VLLHQSTIWVSLLGQRSSVAADEMQRHHTRHFDRVPAHHSPSRPRSYLPGIFAQNDQASVQDGLGRSSNPNLLVVLFHFGAAMGRDDQTVERRERYCLLGFGGCAHSCICGLGVVDWPREGAVQIGSAQE
jgi:hypothetical protein